MDTNQTFTATEDNLRNITPAGGVTPAGVGPGQRPHAGCATTPCTGYFLDFATQNEKTTSSVFSTQGFLTLITFTPDQNNPCSTDGTSYRYRFFFLTGTGGYNLAPPAGNFTDYRQYARRRACPRPRSPRRRMGDTIDTILFSGGAVSQQNTAGCAVHDQRELEGAAVRRRGVRPRFRGSRS